MIESNSEFISISNVPDFLSENFGYRPNLATIYRWMKQGVRGVRLKFISLGGRRFTSKELIEEFSESIATVKSAHIIPPRILEARHNQLDSEKVAKELGI